MRKQSKMHDGNSKRAADEQRKIRLQEKFVVSMVMQCKYMDPVHVFATDVVYISVDIATAVNHAISIYVQTVILLLSVVSMFVTCVIGVMPYSCRRSMVVPTQEAGLAINVTAVVYLGHGSYVCLALMICASSVLALIFANKP
jgi:hypothetical protein